MANYINKDDLLEFIETLNFDERMTKEYLIGVIEAEELADVKPIVYGEWIDVGLYVYECSNCYNSLEMWWEDKYKFCPNCGARMKAESEEGATE